MPRYRYIGEGERVYVGPPTLLVAPGEVITAEDNPDPSRFEKVPSPRPARAATNPVQED